MSFATSNRNPRRMPVSAVFAAMAVLVAQLIGAVHWHPATTPSFTVNPQSAIADALCPICQLAFHSPGAIATPIIFAHPGVAHDCLIPLPVPRSPEEFRGWTDSRAPPSHAA